MVCVLQAERELHAQRLCWLRVESVHRVLREIVQENRFSKASSALTAEDKVPTSTSETAAVYLNEYRADVTLLFQQKHELI